MSKKYEKPSIIGPIQCLRGTTGFTWSGGTAHATIHIEGLQKKLAKAKLRKEEFGGLILNTETDQVFELNQTGFDIISWTQEDVTIDNLVKKLGEFYEVEIQTAALDTNEFLLTAYRLL
jgi:hypothetical protein